MMMMMMMMMKMMMIITINDGYAHDMNGTTQ